MGPYGERRRLEALVRLAAESDGIFYAALPDQTFAALDYL